jgi:hypothetical protein
MPEVLLNTNTHSAMGTDDEKDFGFSDGGVDKPVKMQPLPEQPYVPEQQLINGGRIRPDLNQFVVGRYSALLPFGPESDEDLFRELEGSRMASVLADGIPKYYGTWPKVQPPVKWNNQDDDDGQNNGIQSVLADIDQKTFAYTLVEDPEVRTPTGQLYERLLVQFRPLAKRIDQTEVGELIFQRRVKKEDPAFKGDTEKKVELLVIDTASNSPGSYRDMMHGKDKSPENTKAFLDRAFAEAQVQAQAIKQEPPEPEPVCKLLVWVEESPSQRSLRHLESYQKEKHELRKLPKTFCENVPLLSYIPFFGRAKVQGGCKAMAGFVGWSFIAFVGFILSLWTILYLYNDLIIEVDTALVDSIPLPNVFMCVPAVHRIQGQGVWFGTHYTPRNPLATWNSNCSKTYAPYGPFIAGNGAASSTSQAAELLPIQFEHQWMSARPKKGFPSAKKCRVLRKALLGKIECVKLQMTTYLKQVPVNVRDELQDPKLKTARSKMAFWEDNDYNCCAMICRCGASDPENPEKSQPYCKNAFLKQKDVDKDGKIIKSKNQVNKLLAELDPDNICKCSSLVPANFYREQTAKKTIALAEGPNFDINSLSSADLQAKMDEEMQGNPCQLCHHECETNQAKRVEGDKCHQECDVGACAEELEKERLEEKAFATEMGFTITRSKCEECEMKCTTPTCFDVCAKSQDCLDLNKPVEFSAEDMEFMQSMGGPFEDIDIMQSIGGPFSEENTGQQETAGQQENTSSENFGGNNNIQENVGSNNNVQQNNGQNNNLGDNQGSNSGQNQDTNEGSNVNGQNTNQDTNQGSNVNGQNTNQDTNQGSDVNGQNTNQDANQGSDVNGQNTNQDTNQGSDVNGQNTNQDANQGSDVNGQNTNQDTNEGSNVNSQSTNQDTNEGSNVNGQNTSQDTNEGSNVNGQNTNQDPAQDPGAIARQALEAELSAPWNPQADYDALYQQQGGDSMTPAQKEEFKKMNPTPVPCAPACWLTSCLEKAACDNTACAQKCTDATDKNLVKQFVAGSCRQDDFNCPPRGASASPPDPSAPLLDTKSMVKTGEQLCESATHKFNQALCEQCVSCCQWVTQAMTGNKNEPARCWSKIGPTVCGDPSGACSSVLLPTATSAAVSEAAKVVEATDQSVVQKLESYFGDSSCAVMGSEGVKLERKNAREVKFHVYTRKPISNVGLIGYVGTFDGADAADIVVTDAKTGLSRLADTVRVSRVGLLNTVITAALKTDKYVDKRFIDDGYWMWPCRVIDCKGTSKYAYTPSVSSSAYIHHAVQVAFDASADAVYRQGTFNMVRSISKDEAYASDSETVVVVRAEDFMLTTHTKRQKKWAEIYAELGGIVAASMAFIMLMFSKRQLTVKGSANIRDELTSHAKGKAKDLASEKLLGCIPGGDAVSDTSHLVSKSMADAKGALFTATQEVYIFNPAGCLISLGDDVEDSLRSGEPDSCLALFNRYLTCT